MKEISKDKSISPILISSIELLIVVIQMLFDRQSMNSSNSYLSPSTDNKRRSRGKGKKIRRKKGEKFKRVEPEIRQVIDLNIEFLVREYQAEVLIGTDGMRFVAPIPEHITKAIQYGPSVKSFAVYMSQYQLIPYARVQEVFKDQFDLKIS